MCSHFCMLYYLENTEMTECRTCGHSRYKPMTGRGRTLVTHRKPRCFLITLRLQRLFMPLKTTTHMTSHQSHDTVDGMMVHPSDGEGWKHFNSVHPQFLMETKNVHLGLYINRFNPFGSFATLYSCWSVILTVYKLSSGMCLRPEFMFLFMIIIDPNSPSQNIDVCLRPLIDELKYLWSSRALNYDVSRK
jgi:hypothetical protein